METRVFESILSDELGFEPTGDQRMAMDAFARFVASPREDVGFVLKGYAGTGKTSLMGALVRTLAYFKRKSVLLAPTGRAAKVLSTYSGKQAFTIHKKIYFQKSEGGKMGFTLGRNMHRDTIFIVDEASMIANTGVDSGLEQKKLLDDLIEYVYTGVNCKIISFVIDNPVKHIPGCKGRYLPLKGILFMHKF